MVIGFTYPTRQDTDVIQVGKLVPKQMTLRLRSIAATLSEILSRHNTVILIIAVCCGVGVVSLLVLRDLHATNAQARRLYTRSVNGLKRIAEMQYAVQ